MFRFAVVSTRSFGANPPAGTVGDGVRVLVDVAGGPVVGVRVTVGVLVAVAVGGTVVGVTTPILVRNAPATQPEPNPGALIRNQVYAPLTTPKLVTTAWVPFGITSTIELVMPGALRIFRFAVVRTRSFGASPPGGGVGVRVEVLVGSGVDVRVGVFVRVLVGTAVFVGVWVFVATGVFVGV